ncbi:Protein of unknown function [Gryllus bimaculatus]|nr:Protein of unknown function [Gryllus bimaculatus]
MELVARCGAVVQWAKLYCIARCVAEDAWEQRIAAAARSRERLTMLWRWRLAAPVSDDPICVTAREVNKILRDSRTYVTTDGISTRHGSQRAHSYPKSKRRQEYELLALQFFQNAEGASWGQRWGGVHLTAAHLVFVVNGGASPAPVASSSSKGRRR